MKILVAEDERISRRSLQRQLERWGHDVVATADGAEAWREFQQQQFDIVVTDWEMPQVNGLELVERVRAGDGAGYVYLIMLTGRAGKGDLIRGMEAGADDFLPKPFTFEELAERVNRLANGLSEMGVGPGDRVATMQVNTNQCIEACRPQFSR